MPLGFRSLNHDVIAFGFFNIDTDLLLLEHYFIFADDFCSHINLLAGQDDKERAESPWEVYDIAERRHVGDLMGAIHGVRHIGFIGEVYRRFPFPDREDDFRQKPEGHKTRSSVTVILERFARKTTIPLRPDRENGTVSIGEYLFSKEVFQKLIEYVWLGGYPRWKDDVRPAYVREMKERVEKSGHWLLSGILLV